MTDWQKIKPWLGGVIRVLLGAILLWASLAKLHYPRGFVQTVRVFDATPGWLDKPIGYGLPVLELVLAVLLIVGAAVRIAAATSAVLFVIFLIGLVQASARGIKVECGCFSTGGATDGSTSYFPEILLVLVLLAASVYLIVWSMTMGSIEQFLARHDVVIVPSAKRLRTEAGRRKYEAQLAHVQTNARSRTLYLHGSLSLVTVLIVIVGIGVQSGRAKITGSLSATNASVSGGVIYGKKAAATVTIYEDFSSAGSWQFESQTQTKLDAAVKANLAQVRFHPIAVLDGDSKNDYSTRAANAALCASDISVDAFVKLHNLLLGIPGGKRFQPKSGDNGPSDNNLITMAKTYSGFTAAQITTLTTCVNGGTHRPLVEALTEQASKNNVHSTPAVYVNGKKLSANTWAALSAAITKAGVGHPAPSPSPTPSPTPSTPSASVTTTPAASVTTTPKPSSSS